MLLHDFTRFRDRQIRRTHDFVRSDQLLKPVCTPAGDTGDGEELHVPQWMPYEMPSEQSATDALKELLRYMEKHSMEVLHSSTQIIIAPGYEFRVVKAMVTNFHQPQSTLLLLVSAFVHGDWRSIYDYALAHDFRFLSYGDSSLLIP